MYRYAVYARVSTEGQTEGNSLELQERLCRQWGEEQGWTLVEIVTETGSGALLGKNGMNRITELVKTGKVDVVMFFKVDRAGRDGEVFSNFWGNIYGNGVKVALFENRTVFKNLNDLMYETVFTRAMAERECLEIRKRTGPSLLEVLDRGGMTTKPPYGYELHRKTVDGVKIKVPEINNEQAQVVRFIFEEAAGGTARLEIVRQLNERSVPTSRGKGTKWTVQSVNKYLSYGDKYAGHEWHMTYNMESMDTAKTVTFRYPAIISDDLANRALVEVRARRNGRSKHVPYSGRLRCACGATAHRVASRGSKLGSSNQYGCCTMATWTSRRSAGDGRRGERPECSGTITQTYLDKALLRFIDTQQEEGTFISLLRQMLEKLSVAEQGTDVLQRTEQLLLDDRKKTVRALEQLTEVTDDLDMVAVRTFSDKIKRIDAKLSEFSSEIVKRQRAADQTRAALEHLGVPLEVMFVPGGRYVRRMLMPVLDRLQERLLTLRAAVEGNNWEVANRLMLELGLYLQVDFRPMSAVERRESVQVLVDPTTMKRGSGGTDYVGYDTPTFIPEKSSKSRQCSSITRAAGSAHSFVEAFRRTRSFNRGLGKERKDILQERLKRLVERFDTTRNRLLVPVLVDLQIERTVDLEREPRLGVGQTGVAVVLLDVTVRKGAVEANLGRHVSGLLHDGQEMLGEFLRDLLCGSCREAGVPFRAECFTSDTATRDDAQRRPELASIGAYGGTGRAYGVTVDEEADAVPLQNRLDSLMIGVPVAHQAFLGGIHRQTVPQGVERLTVKVRELDGAVRATLETCTVQVHHETRRPGREVRRARHVKKPVGVGVAFMMKVPQARLSLLEGVNVVVEHGGENVEGNVS
jgi:DNA invertase Pin-like site-specific DNA recombinase/uncharacterized protein YaaR (DUF327 family)